MAVKIQYPGIARTISEDFKNLLLFLTPNRLNKDWTYLKDQMEDLRLRLEAEVDYVLKHLPGIIGKLRGNVQSQKTVLRTVERAA